MLVITVWAHTQHKTLCIYTFHAPISSCCFRATHLHRWFKQRSRSGRSTDTITSWCCFCLFSLINQESMFLIPASDLQNEGCASCFEEWLQDKTWGEFLSPFLGESFSDCSIWECICYFNWRPRSLQKDVASSTWTLQIQSDRKAKCSWGLYIYHIYFFVFPCQKATRQTCVKLKMKQLLFPDLLLK